MNNPDIRCYERELGRAVQGFRRRKRVLETFRNSLTPLLEEIDAPIYTDLEKAFGPPKQLAQDLIESIPDLPSPLQRRKKIAIFIFFCVIVTLAYVGVFFSHNMPESQVTISEELNAGIFSDEKYMAGFDTEFKQDDFSWIQGKEYCGYILLFENTNQVDTMISIEYSTHQPPHTLMVPAGEQRVLQIYNACPTEHTISFDTSDGSMSGNVQMFFYLPSR